MNFYVHQFLIENHLFLKKAHHVYLVQLFHLLSLHSQQLIKIMILLIFFKEHQKVFYFLVIFDIISYNFIELHYYS